MEPSILVKQQAAEPNQEKQMPESTVHNKKTKNQKAIQLLFILLALIGHIFLSLGIRFRTPIWVWLTGLSFSSAFFCLGLYLGRWCLDNDRASCDRFVLAVAVITISATLIAISGHNIIPTPVLMPLLWPLIIGYPIGRQYWQKSKERNTTCPDISEPPRG